jgi:hypothetical protein
MNKGTWPVLSDISIRLDDILEILHSYRLHLQFYSSVSIISVTFFYFCQENNSVYSGGGGERGVENNRKFSRPSYVCHP